MPEPPPAFRAHPPPELAFSRVSPRLPDPGRTPSDKKTKAATGHPGSPSPKSHCLRRAAKAHLLRGRTRRSVSAADLHGADRREQAREGARSCTTRECFGVSRSTPAVRAASEESKGAWRLTVARFDRSDSRALRVSHASRLATAPCGRSANAANLTSKAPAPHCGAPRRGCRPSAPRSREREPAGRATRTVPTSECRRRSAGTDERASVCAPPAGSSCREARGSVHPRSQSRDLTPCLEGHVHDPDTLPSYR